MNNLIKKVSVLTKQEALLRALLGRRRQIAASRLDTQRHLIEGVGWIRAAHAHALGGGIPAYYEPLRGRWTNSYPETTGYTIPTLLDCADHLADVGLRELAIDLADYLLAVQAPAGGVTDWQARRTGRQEPVVFDTGQVIFGWLAAWQETGSASYLAAARRAAAWLVATQDADGAWTRNQYRGVPKVIDSRVAWALLLAADASRSPGWRRAAARNLNWALGQQQADGWFSHVGFQPRGPAFTHAIAYAAEGLLESGLLLDNERCVLAARSVADALCQRQRADGSLASTYAAGWRATSRSSCLTGNCQLALLWLRLYQLGGETPYLDAARRAVAFVASTQDVSCHHPGIRGGIAGSYPIYGRYGRFKYPNWAVKFFIDALLALAHASKARGVIPIALECNAVVC